MKEIWRVIEENDNYSVSNTGKVKNNKTEKNLKFHISNQGYVRVNLYNNKDKTRKNKSVSRLVAIAFIDNKENKKEVNHIDGNKLNNNVNNLDWVSSSENKYHAFNTGLRHIRKGIEHHNTRLSESDVKEIRELCSEKISMTEIAKMYNVGRKQIEKIKYKKQWSHI